MNRSRRCRSPVRGHRWRDAALMALGLAGATVIASCGTGPVSLSLNSGSVSACYRGLPTARAALHEDSAKLKGVHRATADSVLHRFPEVTMPSGDDDTEVCTFAFQGQFRPGQVTDAPPTAQGPVAVVVVSSKKLQLVTSYVGAQLPKDLGRRVAVAP